jgi:hypothetical protein
MALPLAVKPVARFAKSANKFKELIMRSYYKLDKDGKRDSFDLGNTKIPEGRSTYREDTPSFESLYTNPGRGKQGGPTAEELDKYEKKQNRGIYTKEKKMPPSPREMAKGGSVTRADGCITKAHTKGKMITMAGGGMC